jgi:Lrp/AsnC family transcriptional regulator of ectoine degradation
MKRQALDATDVRILSALQKHGPLSKTQLAEAVNLSATPCWIRVDKLKKAGIIRGYHADIVLDAVADITQVVVTVSLETHRKTDFERFETRIAGLSEVTSCVATGGGMDYVLTVVTSNLQSFQALMDGLLSDGLGIDRYMTYIVTRTIKSAQPDLPRLLLK